MNSDEYISNAIGIAAILLLVSGIGLNTILLNSTYASTPATLGEPFFIEEGKVTSQKEIGPNATQFTFSTNGTILNGNIEIINTGDILTVSKGKNLAHDQGQGVMSTKDTNETADYSLIGIERVTQEGKLIFHGVAAYSTNSTGKLSFLNNTLGLFRGEGDLNSGNFVSKEWELK